MLNWKNPTSLAEIEKALDSGRLYARTYVGRFWLCRRNGRTRLWKRDAGRFRVPLKAGFRSTSAIDENSPLTDFRVADSREAAEQRSRGKC